jgi:hypothetical protein
MLLYVYILAFPAKVHLCRKQEVPFTLYVFNIKRV